MIKLVGLVGSNAKHSYNRILLQWIKKNYQQQFHLEIIELASFPLFSQNKKTSSLFFVCINIVDNFFCLMYNKLNRNI